ncbi:WSCD family member CG9164-like [Mytilus edulis]|uniref:WSCD family member CG9164-like n=1 Tax=Mytilus edulis TaxID=6550 RepID=UPI0039F0EDB4
MTRIISRRYTKIFYATILIFVVIVTYRLMIQRETRTPKLPFLDKKFRGQDLNDNGCKPKTVWFSKTPLKKTALASYPGSGTRLLRHVLELTTGVLTGSTYCDKQLLQDFEGECTDDETVLTIKTHEWFDKLKYEKAVILIRSPYKSYASLFSHQNGQDIGRGASKVDFDLKFKEFLGSLFDMWRYFNEEWMKDFVGPKYIIFFDNLVQNPKNEIRKLMAFLEFEYTEKDLMCAAKHLKAGIRKKEYEDIDVKQYFTLEQLSKTEEYIKIIETMATEINDIPHHIDRDL